MQIRNKNKRCCHRRLPKFTKRCCLKSLVRFSIQNVIKQIGWSSPSESFFNISFDPQDAPSMNFCNHWNSNDMKLCIAVAISKKQLLVSTCACVIVEMVSHHCASSACAAILFLSTTFGNSFFTNNRQISGHILESKGLSDITVKGHI